MYGGGGTTVVQAPPAPNYQESTRDILKAQVEMAPEVYAREAQYQPLYSALQAAQQAFQTQQSLDIARQAYPQIAEMEADYNAANRAAELTSLQQTLPAYQQAFNTLTPGYAQAVAGAGQLAQSAMQQALNRPQLSAFESGIRDPYGRPLAPQQLQPFSPSFQQPQALQQSLPAQQQVAPAQQPASAPSRIQYNQALEDRFKEASKDLVYQFPNAGVAPKSPGAPIAPQYATGAGVVDKLLGIVRKERGDTPFNQASIDAQKAKEAQYKTDLNAFNLAEAKNISNFVGNLSPANLMTAQGQPATAQQTAPAAGALQIQGTSGPVSAAGGPAIPGGMQGPALPSAISPSPAQAQGGNYTSQMLQRLQAQQQMAPQQQQPYSSLQDTPAGGYVNAVQGFTPTNVVFGAGMPQEAGYLNQVQSAQAAATRAGAVPTAVNVNQVAGPQLQSGLENVNQNTVNQYLSTMPGMQDYASMLAQQSQAELAAGKSLTTEEQRLADQSARAAYAARGTALGPQAVSAEILNRADVANQRYQQRLQNAAQAAGTIQAIYQPALAQSLQRQQAGLEYGLGAQGQAFGQAQARDTMSQQLQAQRYAQAMGTQGAGFEQAMGREGLGQQIQQQRYSQLMGQQQLMQGAQEQAYNQAMGREQLGAGTQQAAFGQALQRNQAEQQRLQNATALQAGQAQLGMGAMSQLQSAQAPILQAFYKQPILQGQENQAQQMAMAMQQQAGPQYFNPESQTGMGSIYGAYNSQLQLAGAQAQANAAAKAGKSSMMGSLGGALIGGLSRFIPV